MAWGRVSVSTSDFSRKEEDEEDDEEEEDKEENDVDLDKEEEDEDEWARREEIGLCEEEAWTEEEPTTIGAVVEALDGKLDIGPAAVVEWIA